MSTLSLIAEQLRSKRIEPKEALLHAADSLNPGENTDLETILRLAANADNSGPGGCRCDEYKQALEEIYNQAQEALA